MISLQVIGRLGADAHVEANNGKPFVSFNIASDNSWTDANGVKHEDTQWISCAYNGDGGNLLQYLTAGKMVYVSGRPSTRIYSSPKQRQMVAGLNLFVNQVELLGGSSELVPGELTNPQTGQLYKVYKAYYVGINDLGSERPAENQTKILWAKNKEYVCDHNGFVMPKVDTPADTTQQTEQSDAPFTEGNDLANQIHGK